MLFDRRLVRHFDWGVFVLAMLIPLAGVVVLYSAGYDTDGRFPWIPGLIEYIPSPALLKQGTFLLASLVVMAVAMSIPTLYLQRLAYVFYGVVVVLLIVVDLIGSVQKGSQRWLDLGPIHLQPSEPMKLALVLALACYLAKYPPKAGGYRLAQLFIPGLMLLIPMGLIMVQPDLGTALAVGGVGAAMLLFVGVDRRVLIWAAIIGIVCAYPAWHGLHDYQQKRILMLFNPEVDPRGSGYHIIQSIIAVGSGEFLGKGLLQGTQTQLEFLPEHSTDFIFSVLAEEWGFLGCVVVLSLYCLFLYRILRVVGRCRDSFSGLVAFGVGATVFIHTMINIGMVIGLLPVVGIPLIMFSYGGSSLLSTMFAIGLVLGISMRRFSYTARS